MDRLLRIWQGRVLMDQDKDPSGGGGGEPAPKNDEVSAQIAALKAELDALKKGKSEPAPSDVDKVRKDLQEKAAREAAIGRMQEAIRFNLSSDKFMEENKEHLGPSYGNPPIDNIKKNESEVKPYIALTVANGGGKRTLYNITPDLKYYLSGHPAEKERLSRLAPKGSILRSLAENTPLRHSPFRLRDLPQRLSPFGGILANSLYRDVKKEKPYRRGDVFKVFENR